MRQDSGYSEVVSVVPPQLTRGGATLYAAADRVYALVQGKIALEAPTGEADLHRRLERAYFGHESHALETT